LPLTVGYNNEEKPGKVSSEEHWRNMRYRFLDQFQTVVTGHNLDDCIETYIFSALHGTAKVIPSVRNNVLRPFLSTPKSQFIDWCQCHDLVWMEDTSNTDTKYMRNYIRHQLMPHALAVNPGLPKLIKKMVLDKQTIAKQ
jgi:tRNA(Ile)-lysidine synthase